MDITQTVDSKSPEELLKQQRRGAAKPLLWVGIASMAMAFAGLTSGYIVSRSALMQRESWLSFSLPSYFYVSTIVIVLSSAVMYWVVRSAKQGSFSNVKSGLYTTLVLGLVFAVLQILGWSQLHDGGVFWTGEGSNTAGSWVYAITGFHLLHMAGGLISLIITSVKASMGKYDKENILGIEMCAIFWHFLDILWVFLFLFLLFYR